MINVVHDPTCRIHKGDVQASQGKSILLYVCLFDYIQTKLYRIIHYISYICIASANIIGSNIVE